MLIVAYDCEGVILTHTVSAEQTVNADYYCRFLQHYLRSAMRCNVSGLLRDNIPILLITLVVMSQKM